jgi:hypothetical protein
VRRWKHVFYGIEVLVYALRVAVLVRAPIVPTVVGGLGGLKSLSASTAEQERIGFACPARKVYVVSVGLSALEQLFHTVMFLGLI